MPCQNGLKKHSLNNLSLKAIWVRLPYISNVYNDLFFLNQVHRVSTSLLKYRRSLVPTAFIALWKELQCFNNARDLINLVALHTLSTIVPPRSNGNESVKRYLFDNFRHFRSWILKSSNDLIKLDLTTVSRPLYFNLIRVSETYKSYVAKPSVIC